MGSRGLCQYTAERSGVYVELLRRVQGRFLCVSDVCAELHTMRGTCLDKKEKTSTMLSNTVASSAFLLYLARLPMATEARWWVFVRVESRVGEKGVLLPLGSGVDPGYFTQSGKLILLAPAIYSYHSNPI